MSPRVKLDELDAKIVRALQKDARANFTDIAKDCSVSTDTISKRFRKMKRTGLIVGTTIILNPKGFGYDQAASIGIRVEYPHVDEVVDSLREMPEIQFCASSMGRYNIFAVAVLKGIEGLAQLKDSIRQHTAVREVTMSILLEINLTLSLQNFKFEVTEKE
jgi:Lrp/AsnC family transcriptional regulator for asnA, asnC and gidA